MTGAKLTSKFSSLSMEISWLPVFPFNDFLSSLVISILSICPLMWWVNISVKVKQKKHECMTKYYAIKCISIDGNREILLTQQLWLSLMITDDHDGHHYY